MAMYRTGSDGKPVRITRRPDRQGKHLIAAFFEGEEYKRFKMVAAALELNTTDKALKFALHLLFEHAEKLGYQHPPNMPHIPKNDDDPRDTD
jgi:hypothetical protein